MGVAYNKRTKDIYTSAVLRRHTGLLDRDEDGYGDVGVIYSLNRETGDISEFYRFNNAQVGTVGNDDNRSYQITLMTHPQMQKHLIKLEI